MILSITHIQCFSSTFRTFLFCLPSVCGVYACKLFSPSSQEIWGTYPLTMVASKAVYVRMDITESKVRWKLVCMQPFTEKA
ncbi:hypothetical protein F5050DRAFT_1746480 [Lentinula boryana]|uniref:Secreted protein n=1 Tax=Lentinula boryana TaxID=40481 RepID=A0ABQ8QI66_9AGAR|nr:hypothetical protein F5050DRAFT_1746480 [Lentinula boryana]